MAKTYRKPNGVTRIVRAKYGGGSTRSKEWGEMREKVRSRDGDKCCKCGHSRKWLNAQGIQLQMNHVQMVARGGTDSGLNLQLECELCHEKNFKHDHLRKKRVIKKKTAKAKSLSYHESLRRNK